LAFESFPAPRTCIDVVSEAFQNSLVKGARQLTLRGTSVGIYYNRNAGVLGSIVLQKWNIFLVDDDYFRITVVKYISNVFLFQTIIDSFKYVSSIYIALQKTIGYRY
jgi:hypothetical protein